MSRLRSVLPGRTPIGLSWGVARQLAAGARPGGEVGLEAPPDWRVERVDRFGPFYTRIVYRLPDGSTRIWTSRRHRLGCELRRPARALLDIGHATSPVHALWRPERLSWWMAVNYLLASMVLLIAVAGRLTGNIAPSSAWWWYLAASGIYAFGSYFGLVSALNAADDLRDNDQGARGYRWWGWQPDRLGYVVTLALLLGSLLFVIRAVLEIGWADGSSFVAFVARALTVLASIIWVVMIGVEVREVRVARFWWEPRNLAWCRAALNFVGAAGFLLGSLMTSVSVDLPVIADGDSAGLLLSLVSAGLFLVGSYLILPELDR